MPSQRTFLSSCPRDWSWSSTSRPPRRSASKFPDADYARRPRWWSRPHHLSYRAALARRPPAGQGPEAARPKTLPTFKAGPQPPYGALTVASGHVSITWTSEDQEGELKFVFVWREFGGPPASEPAHVGFGSRLISRVLKEDFGGSVEVSYGSTGLICRLTAPLENLATSPE